MFNAISIIKFLGGCLVAIAVIINPWVVEYFFSPDQQFDFLWKYFLILLFDFGLALLGSFLYFQTKFVRKMLPEKLLLATWSVLIFSILYSLLIWYLMVEYPG